MIGENSSVSKSDELCGDEERLDFESSNDDIIEELVSRDIHQRTQNTISAYAYCFIAHALFIEAPLIAIEGVFRTGLGTIGIICILLTGCAFGAISFIGGKFEYSVFYSNMLTQSSLLAVEVAVSLAAALSVMIPGVILFVYREFNGIDDWKLRPIPTVLGWVDPRRFAVITLGQGSSAVNVCVKTNMYHDSVDLMDSVVVTSIIDPVCLCFPRQVLLRITESRQET